eukprot:TRINITY_DN28445_c0_g1_i1.p1 TRINITY_DN28445_c0_g1~~TRINITY_DN28445_c0_g1_i1.p1  ORF type:complete len:203 (-),score=56.12 TRINITY_DN28445_c0_g1_i1:111-719(-)
MLQIMPKNQASHAQLCALNHVRHIQQGMASKSSAKDKNVIVFSEKRVVGYSPEQMFKVVADVESYHKFVPYCRRSVVTLKKPHRLSANLNVGFQPFLNLSYTSHVTLIEPYLITAVCKDVKIFDHLKTVWKFSPTKDNDPKACLIDFAVSFSFLSSSHSMVARLFLDSIVRENVKAFIDRTEQKCGPPSREMKQKSVLVRKL